MAVSTVDHIEFHVADARVSAAELCDGFGFAEAGRSYGSVRLRQGDITIVLTEATPGHPAEQYVRRHGDGVAVIALGCDDADDAYARAVGCGAQVLSAADRTVSGFGDVALRFVEQAPSAGATGEFAQTLDHAAMCIPAGELKETVRFCEQALGFQQTFAEYISVGAQGMDSIVVQGPFGGVTFTLLEPDTSRSPGQIDAFLEAHGGAGVQHLALRTDDIAHSVRSLAARGVGFLRTPGAYYDLLGQRLGHTGIPVETLRELAILVDQDHGGQLFQIFSRSTHPRHTFFLELIERRGAATFGTANIKALYEAVERQRAAADE
ncbi:MAG TPA: 4-hydroxyphenylpyruvate dioxygenase [Actinocrinis sp.]|nr:4-hydroxyphenylpyruvate dioxygenase [Actinocrinis sp.]